MKKILPILIPALAIIVLAVGALLLFNNTGVPANTLIATTTSATSTVSIIVDSKTGKITSSDPHLHVTAIQDDGEKVSVPHPEIHHTLKFSSVVNISDRPAFQAQADKLEKILDADPKNFGAWNDLSSVRLTVGDTQGALEINQYLVKIAPNSSVYNANLGLVYGSYLKKYSVAELYYKKAIALSPNMSQFYSALSDVYVSMNAPAKAENLLKEGIKSSPKSTDLYVLLARIYKTEGKSAEAAAEYEAAAKAADSAGNTSLATQIREEASVK